jgi:hypothetical protein
MSPGNDPSRLDNPWRFIAVAVVSATIVVAFGLGFLLLPRYQGRHAPSSEKNSVYRALVFTSTTMPPPQFNLR